MRIKDILFAISPKFGTSITLKGWIKTLRDQKKFAFIEITDGSTIKGIQVIAEASLPNYAELMEDLSTGAAVIIEGQLKESPAKGQNVEVLATSIELVGTCDPETYPLQKKRHSFEFLRTLAHLRPRTNTLGAITRARNALCMASHEFFQKEGFLYIQTPIITAADCEGAGQMFRITTMELNKAPTNSENEIDFTQDFFGKPTFLTVSGQLNAEAYACALKNVYTFGPTFRAENSNTSRHLAEFWMLEPEMAFADLNLNMDVAEAYLKYVLKYLLDNCVEEMPFFDQFISKGLIARLEHIISTPFERITYTQAIDILLKSPKVFEYEVKWGHDLQSEHERYLSEEYFKKPIIVTDYPRDIKAFYMRDNDDGKTVAAMDILFPQIGEIIGGSQREERLDILEKKFRDFHLPEEPYQWYIDLRRYGSVPHSGFGLGFERLVQFATGMENMRDVIAFPRTPQHADF